MSWHFNVERRDEKRRKNRLYDAIISPIASNAGVTRFMITFFPMYGTRLFISSE